MSVSIPGKERDRCTLFFSPLLEYGTFLFEAAVRRLKPFKKLIDIRLVAYQIVSNLEGNIRKSRWRNLDICIGRVKLGIPIGARLEMFACVVESEQSGDECASGRGAYFPNDLQHRPETHNHLLTQAMGSVRNPTGKFLKDLSFVVFAVDPPISKNYVSLLRGKGLSTGSPASQRGWSPRPILQVGHRYWHRCRFHPSSRRHFLFHVCYAAVTNRCLLN